MRPDGPDDPDEPEVPRPEEPDPTGAVALPPKGNFDLFNTTFSATRDVPLDTALPSCKHPNITLSHQKYWTENHTSKPNHGTGVVDVLWVWVRH